MISFIFVAVVIFLTMMIFSYTLKLNVFVTLSATGLSILGISILINGVEGLKNFLTLSIGIIIIGIGFYSLITKGMEFAEKGIGGN